MTRLPHCSRGSPVSDDVVGTGDAAATLALAHAIIAREMLAEDESAATLGDVVLYPHQRRAVARVRSLLRLTGGAMLADATGLGKTFVALATATTFERTLIVTPASLTDAWRRAVSRARLAATILSVERLGRGVPCPLPDPDLVIVDEAHHFRNSSTKRYNALARLCDRARVLLLTATPLQNRRQDLIAELGLFLGDAAVMATDDELARLIVRRRADDMTLRLPAINGPRPLELPVEDDLLDDLLALPPPIPGADEGVAGALVSYTLLRQWASSRAALVAALRRRLAKAIGLVSSLEAGRWPTRSELMAWAHDGDSVQLALPELLTPLGGGNAAAFTSMRLAVEAHADALRGLLERLCHAADPDPVRAASLVEIRQVHQDARIIAFSQHADTVHALSRLLMPRMDGVAELTARGGRVAGGRVSRREVLAQFTPSTSERSVSPSDRIGLLITTDVLSEGLDLQRASVVIHLDLPWNPARLEQRVGRVRRLGSRHEEVFVYMISPPAGAERVLRVEARLRAKLGLASRVTGVSNALAVDATAQPPIAPPELASDVLAVLERWYSADVLRPSGRRAGLHQAAVLAPSDGFLALLAVHGERILLAALDSGAPTCEATVVKQAVSMCEGNATTPTGDECAAAMAAIHDWCRRWSSRYRLAMSSPNGARLRARIKARIEQLLTSAPRHERALLSPLASRAQRTLAVALGAGAERALAELATAADGNQAWLRQIASLADRRGERGAAPSELEPVVVIVLRKATAG